MCLYHYIFQCFGALLYVIFTLKVYKLLENTTYNSNGNLIQ